jgi:lipoyl synthase
LGLFRTSNLPILKTMEPPHRSLTFFYPAFKQMEAPPAVPSSCGTAAVSVTGTECALRCAHCGGKILQNMQAARTPQALKEAAARLAARGGQTLLISGGADAQGRVPLAPFAKTIREIRKELGLKVLVHTGLVSSEQAETLAEAGVDLALLDMIGDLPTIREVYHLQAAVEDYERSLALLTERAVPAAPHVILGLYFGRIRGEAEALRMIARYPIKTLVLVGVRPIPGTAMAKAVPPSPEEMGRLFVQARGLFPETPVVLGCERPLGRHRRETEALALEAGLDGITYPSDQTLRLAAEKMIPVSFQGGCCALLGL